MNLGMLKEYAVQLIDEFSNNATITSDNDIKLKINNLFNIGQIELSQIRKINKVLKIEMTDLADEIYYTINLPNDFKEISKVRYYPENSNNSLNYYVQTNGNEKVLHLKSECLGKYEIEYSAIPKIIDSNTSNDYELEIDIDSQMLLPYYVASDILKSDVSADYTLFEAKYRNKLEILNSRNNNETFLTINQFSII